MLTWDDFRRILKDERLPAGVADLDAVRANAATLSGLLKPGKTIRVASKSVRHVGLLKRIFELGGDRFRGLMCFTVDEACFLADQGFDDLLVAYPTVQAGPLEALAERVARGTTAWVICDHPDHLQALARAGRAANTTLHAAIELDVAYRPLGGAVHLGARRSPIRSVEQAVSVAAHAKDLDGVEVTGLMAYEAHVAGVQDDTPFARAMNRPKRWMKALAQPVVARMRADAVKALRDDGHDIRVVNGGGTGSVALTSSEDVVTEVAAGSGFLCSHLFSYFAGLQLQPALFFAIEAVRHSDPGYVTGHGGGIVASGEPGWDKVPVPWLPEGLRFVDMEAAGEVQTPLILSRETPDIALGDPLIFRPAKAGEPAERFNEYLLVADGAIVAREPTYRGMGQCFL